MTPGAFSLDTLLLKVASRCNLNCSYCYVYHMGDDGWRDQPKLMSSKVIDAVAGALAEQVKLQAKPLSVVLHGGEPLMLGPQRLASLCSRLRDALPKPCGIHVQTNGVLLTDAIVEIFIEYDVGISISLDGDRDVHDRFRMDHTGLGSYERVANAIAKLRSNEKASRLFAGVLAVIDPRTDPGSVYNSLKKTGSPSLDFLVRDGNWDQLPFGKESPESVEYGAWLSGLLQVYLEDPHPPRVRILDDMLRLLLGGQSQKEGVGMSDYGILVIEPDGRIHKNDTLKVAHPAADRFRRPWSILRNSFAEVLNSTEYDAYFVQQRPTSLECKGCPDLTICGGGMVAHRWSTKGGYDNPSVFCADQKHLIARMRHEVELQLNRAA